MLKCWARVGLTRRVLVSFGFGFGFGLRLRRSRLSKGFAKVAKEETTTKETGSFIPSEVVKNSTDELLQAKGPFEE